jgi:hypothetical protein
VGSEYRLVGATDEIVTANVRWLAGYRHPAMTSRGRRMRCGGCSPPQRR